MEELRYPIYSFSLSWNQKDFKNNGTGFQVMFKETPTNERLDDIILKNKQNIEGKYNDVEWLKTEYKYIEHETWCINWFNHYTYNQFDNDRDVRDSFEDFIERKKLFNIQNGHRATEQIWDNNSPFYCLMGAEDRWKWNICRCEHCQKQGKITIDH